MLLVVRRLPSTGAFSPARLRIARNKVPSFQTLLFSSLKARVEISPSDHGTKPIKSLVSQNAFHPLLAQALRAQNITNPTPIQAHGIPLLKKRYDVMGSAQTGTGKTFMFTLPLCERLLLADGRKRNQKAPAALILNPTRELAMQTAGALEKLTSKTSLRIALATGGESVAKQKRQLGSCDILVGTPGRILQFVDERILKLQSITEVVVDEADRMLDLGFEPDLRRIARALGRNNRDQRCTVLCSATFPPDVQRVAADFLKQNYYFVSAGRVGATHQGILQTLKWVESPTDRRKVAVSEVKTFLKQNASSPRVIVFCNTKDEAERIGSALKGPNVRVVTGDKQQSERNKSLAAFRKGRVQVLVATDVAARGLDVDNIGLVVQVDAPREVDTFVHRVGRTGRAGAKGRAVALLDGRSVGIAASLVELMDEANQHVPAWLLGMSYVARARAREEEVAVAAGGGGSLDVEMDSEQASDEASSNLFSEQDFRRGADVGSWGSERDTSYHSFDEEAYSSLDSDVGSSVGSDTEFRCIEEEGFARVKSASRSKQVIAAEENPSSAVHFKRQKPSKDLCRALKNISGSDRISKKPDRTVLRTLSKRGANQRLRFEYLGMFPFENISEMLQSRADNGFSRKNNDSSKLPRVLMVAEKPSIAKAIADALSGPRGARQTRGISRALPVYEFTSDAFVPSDANRVDEKQAKSLIVVTSVVGHVFSLGFAEKQVQGRVDPSEFFRMPVVKQEEGSTSKLRVVDHLRALAAESDHLVLWLDCDSEGENIAHEVIGVTRRALQRRPSNANPDAPTQRRVHRARFSAITGQALRDAFAALEEPDAELSRSVDARQELDLRVGVALTRLLTWRCVGLARQNFSPATKFISYGPCQTPTLSFCVDRAREIEAFQPEEYWKVQITVFLPGEENDDSAALKWIPPQGSQVRNTKISRRRVARDRANSESQNEESATFDKTAAERVVQLAAGGKSSATVVQVEEISERIDPPLGLNTVALLAAGSKAMGMSPKKVMQVAEKLYSAGLISYPRTETTRYDAKGFDVRTTLRDHISHPEWGRTASHLLRTKYAKSGKPPARGYDAGDHPPITCLKAATRDDVGGGAEWRVYEFIARNYLGSLSDELKYTRRVADLHLNGDKTQRFALEQIRVDSLGFAGACRWVLRDIGASNNKKKGVQQEFRAGMSLPLVDAKCELRTTRPPRFLQEHELIELMDTNRIGTDASMATHVNNIVDRGYVTLCDETGALLRPPRPPRPGQRQLPRQVGRYLVPTPLGIGLVNLFDRTANVPTKQESLALLSRPAIRAQMEEEVKQIAMGGLDKEECVDQNLAWFLERYNELVESLTRKRLNDFARTLRPTKDALHHWRRIGAFEKQQPNKQESKAHQGGRARGKRASSKRRINKSKHRSRRMPHAAKKRSPLSKQHTAKS